MTRSEEFAAGGSPGTKCVKCGVESMSGNKLFTRDDAGQTVCKAKTACTRRANAKPLKRY